ncbi:MAG: hypothetical protein K6B44_04275 [Lachnospiraceae bacterium]|nr:hypothetical protein [Lachnospiraceae bacterium]
MKDEEEYLDRLLQAALNKGKAAEPEEPEPDEAEALFGASKSLRNLASETPKKDIGSGALPSFRQVVDAEEKGEDLSESFKQPEEMQAAAEIPELNDVSDVMNLFGDAEGAAEEIPEETEVVDLSEFRAMHDEEEPVYDNPEPELTADEIAAMYAAEPVMYGEETEDAPVEEEPVYEDVPAEEEALYEEPAVEEEPIHEEQPVIEEEPVYEDTPVTDDDPNRQLSPEEIAAMFGSALPEEEAVYEEEPLAEEAVYEDAPAVEEEPVYEEQPVIEEEPVYEEEPAAEEEPVYEEMPAVDDDPNRQLSPEEIAAMFDAGAGEDPRDIPADPEKSDDDMADELMALLGEADAIEAAPEVEEMPAAEAEFPAAEAALSDDIGLDDLSLDDIESRMKEAEAASEEADPLAAAEDDADVTALLESLGSDDMDLSDIGDILKKSDNNEIVDQSITEQPDAEMPEDPLGEETSEEAEEEGGKKKKKKLFGKKKKKGEGEDSEEGEEGKKEKKPGFFTKLLDMLIKEEDEDPVPESQSLRLSDENKAILDELDKEAEEGGKGKKKKEKNHKKEKPKKEKKPKPKKEKKVKPKVEENTRKIPKKYVRRTFLLAASILVALLLVTLYLPGMKTMEDARKAFYENKDYKTVFLTFYGKELSESDMKIYRQSRMVVLLDRKYESYENYKRMNMQEEALDALLQGLKRYDDLQEEAIELGMGSEIIGVRGNILAALYSDYGIDEQTAYEILGYSNLDYSGKIKATVKGQPYIKIEDEMRQKYGLSEPVQETVQEEVPEPQPGVLPDMLPEEQQYLEQKDAEPEAEEAPQDRPLPAEADTDGRDVPVEINSDQF